ncbi:MAG: D-alanyl-D-alanine carboxypeptidase family protein [Solirubrobacteraceae bacterium]
MLLVLVLAACVRALSEHSPTLILHQRIPSTVRIPGPGPRLLWPASGQAAVAVQGIGKMGSFGGSSPIPIASVAKIMTAYLTLSEAPLPRGSSGFTLTITPADVAEERRRAAQGQSVLAVRTGERLTERQALQALLLPSANNVATLLAHHSPGGMQGFLVRMNETARALKMTATTYTSPSGYDSSTVSSAADQLRLAEVAMRIPAFAQMVSLRTVRLPDAGEVSNYNGLVDRDGYIGIKTGSDQAAGGCLVFAKRVRIGTHHLLIFGAVLGQHEGPIIQAALKSAQQLGDSAADALHIDDVVAAGTAVMTVTGVGHRHVSVIATRPLRELGWSGLHVAIKIRLEPVKSELHRNQKVATISTSGTISDSISAIASRSLGGPSLGWRLTHIV